MVAYPHYPLNTPFKPAPSLVSLLITRFTVFVLLIFGFTGFPILLEAGSDLLVNGFIVAGFLVIIAIFVIWARLYYVSMWYELREDEISWKRGVWFRTTGIVPYNRITNLDIRQGPLMRMFGISTLALQTAGYSGQAVPEIKIEGQIHADELRELIRFMVRGNTAHGDGTGGVSPAKAPLTMDEQVLVELVKIRTLLEQQGQK
ncbi:MAG: PH domain-containing protein [Methanoregula sp.]|jgi:hypothetical protein